MDNLSNSSFLLSSGESWTDCLTGLLRIRFIASWCVNVIEQSSQLLLFGERALLL
jgi:hypothetical protein